MTKAVTTDEEATRSGLRAALVSPAAITAGFTSGSLVCADNTAWSFSATAQTAQCDGTSDGRTITSVV